MKKFPILIILTLLAFSCAMPRVITRLSPDSVQGHYELGREYITLENDSITVELGFDGFHGESMVFDFVVINQTPASLQLNPSEFYYVQLDSALADTTKLPPRMAYHPERILHRYDESIKSRQEEKTANTILGFLDAGISLIANTTAFIATEDPGYVVDAVFSTLGTASHYVANDQMIKQDLVHIGEEKEIIKGELFRAGELPPGKAVNGYVYFPRNSNADCLMFCFPLEDQLFQFVYNQEHVVQYY